MTKKHKILNVENFTILSVRANKKLIQRENKEKKNLLNTLLTFIILLIMFGFFYILLIILISETYQRYRYFIIKAWLIPSLIDAFFKGLYSSILSNIIKSYIVFNFNYLNETKGIKNFLYKVYVSSEVHSLFKIRKLILKYRTELKPIFNSK